MQNFDSDEEDDYEGYFLQPAQGYDIAEKIKQANQMLELECSQPAVRTNRVVRFRTVLEDYEPDYLDGLNSKLSDIIEDVDNTDTVVEEIIEEIQEVNLIETSRDLACINTTEPNIYVSEYDPVVVFEAQQEDELESYKIISSNAENSVQTDKNSSKITDKASQFNKSKPFKQSEENISHRLRCKKNKYGEKPQLPKYNGFYSEYGLSKEQLDHRQKVFEDKLYKSFSYRIRKFEERNDRINMNENAFKTWLSKKMRNPFNHSKNMFNSKIKPIK